MALLLHDGKSHAKFFLHSHQLVLGIRNAAPRFFLFANELFYFLLGPNEIMPRIYDFVIFSWVDNEESEGCWILFSP